MDTPAISIDTSFTHLLKKVGLTESQARGYLALIEHGTLTPVDLAEITGESRTNGYMICEKLESLSLARKQDGTKLSYAPENPTRLRQLLIAQQRSLKQASDELGGALPGLLSTYQLKVNKPGVLYLEGLDSLKLIYDDIIKSGDSLRIFPSSHDRDDPAIAAMIDQQIGRQRKAGIKTEVLMRDDALSHFTEHNDNLFEARRGIFDGLDAQIMLYGPHVAITTFTQGVVTTIITNQLIASTFNALFEAQWRLSSLESTGSG